MNKYEEHLASQPDNSRWHGFDRGDTGIARTTRECVGRMTNGAGQRIAVWEEITDNGWGDTSGQCTVTVNGDRVYCSDSPRERAIEVARWWMAGCPA